MYRTLYIIISFKKFCLNIKILHHETAGISKHLKTPPWKRKLNCPNFHTVNIKNTRARNPCEYRKFVSKLAIAKPEVELQSIFLVHPQLPCTYCHSQRYELLEPRIYLILISNFPVLFSPIHIITHQHFPIVSYFPKMWSPHRGATFVMGFAPKGISCLCKIRTIISHTSPSCISKSRTLHRAVVIPSSG